MFLAQPSLKKHYWLTEMNPAWLSSSIGLLVCFAFSISPSAKAVAAQIVSMPALMVPVRAVAPSDLGPKESSPLVHVNLIVQEAVYPGIPGVARRQEPVNVGVPIADSAGIKSTSQLGLAGASAGQFRVLGRWPSGNIEWVLVDTLADVAAGKTNTAISMTRGSGNFGGPILATEDAAYITIATGASKFVVKKKNFDLIDQAVVDDHVLVKAGASAGLVVVGPSPGSTVCPCSTVYSSSNDPASTAVIEENGPVRAAVRATGQLEDSSGHAYMRYTVRLHFYKGKSRTKAVVLLQNADYGPSRSFASAYKGFLSFEARLTPTLDSGRSFSFGAARSPVADAFVGNENAYLYQAYSDKMEHPQWSSPDTRGHYAPRSYIRRTLADRAGSHRTWAYSQEGYVVTHKDANLARGRRSEYSAGWADLADANGAGVEIGAYQMAAYWPKSLQFMNGGSEIRIGIWPEQSLFGPGGQEYYQAWPQYSMQTIYLNFHSSGLSEPAEDCEKFQYPLIARAPASYYNETKALFYPIVDPEREDRYFKSLGITCCAKDLASPRVYRTYNWAAAGGGNQAEMRWSDLMLWLQRGHVARYLDAAHFYTFQGEQVFPRSDYNEATSFNWRDRPDSELGPTGLPEGIASLNDNTGCDSGELKCGRNWIDSAHAHWYGMVDYYFMSGDETIKDAILDGATDVYGNPNIKSVKNGTYWNPRNIGEALMSNARLALFYRAIGDSRDADNALLAGTQILSKQVWPELQVSGFGTSSQGVSRTRGLHFGCCPPSGQRVVMPFQEGILAEGLWEFLQAEGPEWPQHQSTFDLAYGIATWALTEAWRPSGKGSGCRGGSGPAYEIFIDRSNGSLDPSCSQTMWFNFYNLAKYTGDPKLWTDKFSQYIQHLNGNGSFYAEYGTIFESAVVSEALDSEPLQLVSVPLTVERSSPDTYRLAWTVPAGAQSYRIKFSDKNIVEWLDFDPVTNHFSTDPGANIPWFAASDMSGSPQPGAIGTTQTHTVGGLDPKAQWHFALKAYIRR